jgi:hypothetical protein
MNLFFYTIVSVSLFIFIFAFLCAKTRNAIASIFDFLHFLHHRSQALIMADLSKVFSSYWPRSREKGLAGFISVDAILENDEFLNSLGIPLEKMSELTAQALNDNEFTFRDYVSIRNLFFMIIFIYFNHS